MTSYKEWFQGQFYRPIVPSLVNQPKQIFGNENFMQNKTTLKSNGKKIVNLFGKRLCIKNNVF